MKPIKNDHAFSNERLIDYDPVSGIRTYGSSEVVKGEEVWAIRQDFDDVSPEVDAAKVLANDPEHWKKGVKESWLHYGHIPDPVLLQWHVQGVDINNPQELFKMVNRPEYAYLRCTPKIHTVSA